MRRHVYVSYRCYKCADIHNLTIKTNIKVNLKASNEKMFVRLNVWSVKWCTNKAIRCCFGAVRCICQNASFLRDTYIMSTYRNVCLCKCWTNSLWCHRSRHTKKSNGPNANVLVLPINANGLALMLCIWFHHIHNQSINTDALVKMYVDMQKCCHWHRNNANVNHIKLAWF